MVRSGEQWSCRVTVSGREGTETIESAPFQVPEPIGGNVLLVVLDDVGIDKIAAWGAHPQPAHTPRIDALIRQGIRFRTAYAQPSCSTSRSQLLTGRYGLRTGFVRTDLGGHPGFALPAGETTIAELLVDQSTTGPWTTAAFGKWHLVDRAQFTADTVTREGFGTFQGTVANLAGDYFGWEQWWADGSVSDRTGYVTTAVVDDTSAFLATAPEPWFVWLALHSAHEPIHVPPPHLTTTHPAADAPDADRVDAMIEAADTELGRLLDEMDPEVLAHTTILLLGDNGTAKHAVRPPLKPESAKATVQEGGVRVPLIVSGYAVEGPGRASSALVSSVDLFATIADLAGVPMSGDGALWLLGAPPVPIDGVSLVPLLRDPDAAGERRTLYAGKGEPNGPPPWGNVSETVRDAEWKYVAAPWGEELYHLTDDTLDQGPNLLDGELPADAEAARDRLAAELGRLHEIPYAW